MQVPEVLVSAPPLEGELLEVFHQNGSIEKLPSPAKG